MSHDRSSTLPLAEWKRQLRRQLQPQLETLRLAGLSVAALQFRYAGLPEALRDIFGFDRLRQFAAGATQPAPSSPAWFTIRDVGDRIVEILRSAPAPARAQDESEDSPETEAAEDDAVDDVGMFGLTGKTPFEITHPFDPNKIRVRSWTPTVYNLMERLKHGELDLAPEFQRKAGIWRDARQSRLIESLLIRIPLPAFYLDEIPPSPGSVSERYSVVDGVQRLTVLDRFINKKELTLSGLEFLTQLNGESFDTLDPPLQRRILETQLAVNIVEPGTPEEAKLNVFKRINTGGVALNAQEIRHAMNPGPVRGFLGELARSDEFRLAVGIDSSAKMDERMEDRECAIRFIAFSDSGVDDYRRADTDFDGFLHRAMKRINKCSDAERFALSSRFKRAMAAAHRCFGPFAFRKISLAGRRGRINKALFEATAVTLDQISDAQVASLAKRRDPLIARYRLILQDPVINAAVSVGTGDPKRVERRFEALREIVVGALHD